MNNIPAWNVLSQALVVIGLIGLFSSQIDYSVVLANIITGYEALWYSIVDFFLWPFSLKLPDRIKDIILIWSGLSISFQAVLKGIRDNIHYNDEFGLKGRNYDRGDNITITVIRRPRLSIFERLRIISLPQRRLILKIIDYIVAPFWYLFLFIYYPFSASARIEASIAIKSLINIAILFVLAIGLNYFLRFIGL